MINLSLQTSDPNGRSFHFVDEQTGRKVELRFTNDGETWLMDSEEQKVVHSEPTFQRMQPLRRFAHRVGD